MAVIHQFRGRAAAHADLGLNLYSGCAVGCQNCSEPWARRMTWESWTSGAGREKIFCLN